MQPRVLIYVLAALSMIGSLSYDAYMPALPAIAGDFKTSLVVAQQSLTIYMVAFATMTLFYGMLSDSFGRRPVILIALAIYLAGTIGVGCSRTVAWLMFFRLVQGLCAGAGSVISNAVINDLFIEREAERMTSYVSMLFGLAPAIAPILGGYIQVGFGWRAIFLFIAIFTAVLLAVCLRVLPESLPPDKRHAFHFKVIVAQLLAGRAPSRLPHAGGGQRPGLLRDHALHRLRARVHLQHPAPEGDPVRLALHPDHRRADARLDDSRAHEPPLFRRRRPSASAMSSSARRRSSTSFTVPCCRLAFRGPRCRWPWPRLAPRWRDRP